MHLLLLFVVQFDAAAGMCWEAPRTIGRITYLLGSYSLQVPSYLPRSSPLGLQYACGRASRAARTKEFAFTHHESMADILTNCRDVHVQYSKVR